MNFPNAAQLCKYEGFEAVQLVSDEISMITVPALGGKIVSLFDRKGGREWLWTRPADHSQKRVWRNELGDSFDKSPMCGADECLPTISAVQGGGRSVPDHGEVWSQALELEQAALRDGVIRTHLNLPVSPFRYEREIRLAGTTVEIRFQLQNLSDEAEAWLWAWHPLFALEDGDHVELPEKQCPFHVGSSQGVEPIPGDCFPWPGIAQGLALDHLSLNSDASYLKGFLGALNRGRICIGNERLQAFLKIDWDTDRLPYLGFWLSRGGYLGFHQFALEPTNAPTDSLADAAGPQTVLAPRQSVGWSLMISLHSAA